MGNNVWTVSNIGWNSSQNDHIDEICDATYRNVLTIGNNLWSICKNFTKRQSFGEKIHLELEKVRMAQIPQ